MCYYGYVPIQIQRPLSLAESKASSTCIEDSNCEAGYFLKTCICHSELSYRSIENVRPKDEKEKNGRANMYMRMATREASASQSLSVPYFDLTQPPCSHPDTGMPSPGAAEACRRLERHLSDGGANGSEADVGPGDVAGAMLAIVSTASCQEKTEKTYASGLLAMTSAGTPESAAQSPRATPGVEASPSLGQAPSSQSMLA